MVQKAACIVLCIALGSCASKQLQTSLNSLRKENQALKSEVAKLQEQVNGLSDDVLVVQNRIERNSAPIAQPVVLVAPPAPAVAVIESPKIEKKEKPTSIFGDNMEFQDDDEPPLHFSNKDLSAAPPVKGLPAGTQVQSSVSSAVTEQTLIANNNKAETEEQGIEDPAIVASYNKAYRTFQQKNYPETIRLMEDFYRKYGHHRYADNALFWMGESEFQLKNYKKANAEFQKVIQDYPNGNKVPDSLLRSGICDLKLSQPEVAKMTFTTLMQKYPESLAAKRAKSTLGEL